MVAPCSVLLEQLSDLASSVTITFCINPTLSLNISSNSLGSDLINIARYTSSSYKLINNWDIIKRGDTPTWVRAMAEWSPPHALKISCRSSYCGRGLRKNGKKSILYILYCNSPSLPPFPLTV